MLHWLACKKSERETNGLQSCADQELARRSLASMLAVLLLFPVLAFGTDIPTRHPKTYLNMQLAVGFLSLWRIGIVWRSSWANGHQCSRILLPVNMMAMSITWGALLTHLLAEDGFYCWDSMLVLMICTGIGGGAIATMMSHYYLLVFNMAVCVAPVIVLALLDGGFRGQVVASGFLLLAMFLLLQGRQLHRQYWTGLENNFRLQRSLEDLELARAQAELAARAKQEFLTNMSHELRTPMNGVLGMVDLTLDTPLDRDQREYLQTARTAGQSLMRLLNDVMDVSRLETGQLTLEPRPFSVGELLEHIRTATHARIGKRPVRFVYEISPMVPDRLVGDARVLRQILDNLLDNALKFTEMGDIRLAVRPETGQDSEVRTVFEVSDTGIGIPASLQHSIFQVFVQGDGSLNRRRGGAGVGLTLCARLVEQMGGSLRVHSTPGVGSTFWFSVALPPPARSLPP